MADMANILVKDDTGSNVTLVPISNADKNLVWRGNIAGVPLMGQPRLTAVWDTLKDNGYRLSAKLEVPVMETIGASAPTGYVAAPKVAYVMVGIVTLFAPARSTTADRANTVRMLTHLMTGAGVSSGAGLGVVTAIADTYKNAISDYVLPYSLVNVAMPN